jgi:hypothetical protein
MSFSGYLLKAGGTAIPLDCISLETYQITPNQRMEVEAKRDTNGNLHRTTVNHTASKIEFETPYLTEAQQSNLMSIIRSSWTSVTERKSALSYYDPETNSYKNGYFYMPDVQWKIYQVDTQNNKIIFGKTKISFIEY